MLLEKNNNMLWICFNCW